MRAVLTIYKLNGSIKDFEQDGHSATNKERVLTEIQNYIDYCVRLLSSDTVNA